MVNRAAAYVSCNIEHVSTDAGGGCRLQDLVQEVDAQPAEGPQGLAMPRIQGPPGSKMLGVQVAGGGGYKAPLLARVHLRLGMWSWTYQVTAFVPPCLCPSTPLASGVSPKREFDTIHLLL